MRPELAAALPIADVYTALDTSADGLAAGEAAARRARTGANALPRPPALTHFRRFLAGLVHFMALLLWAAGALAFASGTPQLGWAIWAVILINAAFSYWQEDRAERAMAELAKLLP